MTDNLAESNVPLYRLDAVVADDLQKSECGAPPDRDSLLAAHPDLADRLHAGMHRERNLAILKLCWIRTIAGNAAINEDGGTIAWSRPPIG